MARSCGPSHSFEQNPIQAATDIRLQSIWVASGPPKSTTSDEPTDLHPGHDIDAGQQESQLNTTAAFQFSIHPMQAQINLDQQQQIRPTTTGRAHCSTPKFQMKLGDPMS
ncbi:hypothetical protein ACLOJK_037227 [Asimina triloba]